MSGCGILAPMVFCLASTVTHSHSPCFSLEAHTGESYALKYPAGPYRGARNRGLRVVFVFIRQQHECAF